MSNICHECVFHEKCMAYRYSNIRTKCMEEITVKENKEGMPIIYVEKCRNFSKRTFKFYPEKLEALKKGLDKVE